MYLLWFDDTKAAPADKIQRALVAFQERFGYAASVVWINESETVSPIGVAVESKPFVRPNNYWLGDVRV